MAFATNYTKNPSLHFLSTEHSEKLGFLDDVEMGFLNVCYMMSKMVTNDVVVTESLCISA